MRKLPRKFWVDLDDMQVYSEEGMRVVGRVINYSEHKGGEHESIGEPSVEIGPREVMICIVAS